MEQGNAIQNTSTPSPNGLQTTSSKSNLSRSTISEHEGSAASDQNSVQPSVEGSPRNTVRSATTGGQQREPGPSGISRLIPGARRRHRKKKEAEAAVGENGENGTGMHTAAQSEDSLASLDEQGESMSDHGRNATANGAGSDAHAVRDSYNASSPAIISKTSATDETRPISAPKEGPARNSESTSGRSGRSAKRASTLGAPERSRSASKSPSVGSLREEFTSSHASQRPTSPDRSSTKSSGSKRSKRSLFKPSRRRSQSTKKSAKAAEDAPPVPTPPPIMTTGIQSKPPEEEPPETPPEGPTEEPPKTPPRQTTPPAPTMAIVTPPTPTDNRPLSPPMPFSEIVESPPPIEPPPSLPPNAVVSPSGNMISHRRVRSASAAQPKSKVSNGMASSTEDTSTQGSGGGFLSSMFSAAQNAASSLSSSINAQSRGRSLTEPAEKDKQSQLDTEEPQTESGPLDDNETEEKRELAVDTLGMGELDFSHLGIDTTAGGVIRTNDGVVFTKMDRSGRSRKGTVSQRDELAAKIEDVRAAQAVSMAYGKPPESVEESQQQSRPSAPASGTGKDSTDEHTPVNGSVVGDDVPDSVKRRGRTQPRLRRSSGTTGTVGAIGAAVGGLALPGMPLGSVPRLTGFAVASKKRNRDFHQLFRSVPEDDYLIEDYSCALQREIILAGRIYISEGHICFSSNILGWVTTLVIGFDEVVAIEKESTAMVFPNAIAIKTLHARHTFRSLLSRDSTYDLTVNIWKINHPTLKSTVNGTQIAQGTGDKTEKADVTDGDTASDSDEEEVYDEDEEGAEDGVPAEDGDGSVVSSERPESVKAPNRKASTPLSAGGPVPAAAQAVNGESKPKDRAVSSAETSAEFPGPKTHPPTEYTDPSGYYERLVKDEIIPAPLGRVYSLVFGPASGGFMSKFLLNYQKVADLQFEDDKTGLTNENRVRTYSYIKPLNASIGPKQTRCISTENLDFMDLEKSVLVTLTTQTPDVPNGNVFSVKTKYLFTWAQGNSTRFYMSCTVEWTGKSWIKGPVEKGANDGQLSFGTDLVKALKSGISPRPRPGKGGSKPKPKRMKTNTGDVDPATAANAATKAASQSTNWGFFEPLRQILGPFAETLQQLLNGNVALGLICILLFMMWFRTPGQSSVGRPAVGFSPPLSEQMLAYEELWQREESELWDWLEERVGLDATGFPVTATGNENPRSKGKQQPQRHLSRSEKDIEARLRDERMSEREVDDAIRITNERLDTLRRVVEKRKANRPDSEGNEATA